MSILLVNLLDGLPRKLVWKLQIMRSPTWRELAWKDTIFRGWCVHFLCGCLFLSPSHHTFHISLLENRFIIDTGNGYALSRWQGGCRLITYDIFKDMYNDKKSRFMMTSSNGNISGIQRPATRSFRAIFDLRLNKPLGKQSWAWWFETLPRPLWRHCNVKSTFSKRSLF